MKGRRWVIILALGSLFLLLWSAGAPAQKGRTTIPRVLGNDRTTDLSGLSALTPFSDLPYQDQDLQSICEIKRRTIENALQGSTDYLAALGRPEAQNRDHLEIVKLAYQLGQLWAYQGEMRKSIEHFAMAYQIAAAQNMPDRLPTLEEMLGVAEMRRGEIENCRDYHNQRSCILPIRAEGRHRLPSGSEAAIRHFLLCLERDPENFEVRWLLNIASMTLGSYPAGVPKEYLIPPAAFESGQDIGGFVDVAPAAGLNIDNVAGSSVMEDFDNDGFFDVVTSSQDACAPMHLFHNEGNGRFSDRAAAAGITGQLGGLNAVQTDYNNDGWADIFVLRGGWEFPMRNSLLRNNGDGTFTDVTRQAGLAGPAYSSQTAAWGDFDNDGCLDVFVGHELAPSQLFRNRCDGTFEDVSARAGVNRSAFTKGAVWGDYDNDGYPDLYVSNYGQTNFLYHNNRDGTFTEVAARLGVEKPLYSFPVWFWDYNNDGCLDLFVPSFVQSVSEVTRSYLHLPVHAETMKLYRNNCHGGFDDVTREMGLDRVTMAMGANFGDVDNDGYPDLYLGTGAPSYAALVPNIMYRNQEGKHFVDITSSSGTGHLQKGHGVAFGDINNDGDQDIFLHVGGAVPGDAYGNVLFRNPGHKNHWIRLKLAGVKTNRAAIGARIKAVLKDREVHAMVTSGGSFGANPLEQHLGLGQAVEIERLEVWWPASGTRQVFPHVKADQFLQITEFGKTYRRVTHRSFPLAAGNPPETHHHAAR